MFTNESSEIISMTTAVMNGSYLPTEAAATVVIAIFHSSCKYILDADITLARFRGAEQTDATPRPTIPKHPSLPPDHSTARHDARLEEETTRRRQPQPCSPPFYGIYSNFYLVTHVSLSCI